jgi:hypothetical protein
MSNRVPTRFTPCLRRDHDRLTRRGDDGGMKLGPLRLFVAAIAVLALALPASGIGATADPTIDRGIVQSVGSGQIALRALDGNVSSFAVSAATHVRLNGQPSSLANLLPGYVASVAHNGAAAAVWIRAFGKPPVLSERGIVTALTRTAITLRTDGGASVTVPLDPSTRFRFRGVPAARFLARPGAIVAVKHTADGPAKVVNVLRRARA